MADETNEDSWLYGSSNPDSTTNEEEKTEPSSQQDAQKPEGDGPAQNNNTTAEEGQQSPDSNEKQKEPGEDPADEMEEQETENEIEKDPADSDLDDSDDDINVVIGDIKSGPTTYNIKQRANLIAPAVAIIQEKSKPSAGKFNIEEFESVGTINGMPAHEFSIDSLDEKPWRKPGADITDYFNYGFNEETWRAYCERQKRFRMNESGVGLQGLAAGPNVIAQAAANNRTLTPLTSNENSKYAGQMGPPRRQGPPQVPAKENVIQVMTAERREYSRPGGPPFGDQYFEAEAYNYGYEPTQDSQWMNDNPGWAPTGIKELTPGPQMVPPPMVAMVPPIPPIPHMAMRGPIPPPPMVAMPPMHMGPMNMMPPARMMPTPIERDRERERERDRSERDRSERERERERERDRDRDRDWDREIERDRHHDRHRERGKSEESERQVAGDSPSRDRERRRAERRERERERESRSKRERSRSRESRARRRSRSREKDRERVKSRDKKKHRKDKEDSE